LDDTGQCLRPAFSFAKIDWHYQGKWGWHLLRNDREVLEFLRQLSTDSWTELLALDRGTRHHFQPIDTLPREAQERLEHQGWDDQERVFRFRASGKKRLWGFLVDGIFFVVWWDPHHKVYPVEKD
jgi:hypothetical protein